MHTIIVIVGGLSMLGLREGLAFLDSFSVVDK